MQWLQGKAGYGVWISLTWVLVCCYLVDFQHLCHLFSLQTQSVITGSCRLKHEGQHIRLVTAKYQNNKSLNKGISLALTLEGTQQLHQNDFNTDASL